jgi:hypothetical protein
LPGVGFFWEYLQPEVYTENSTGHSLSGLGDPLVDGTIYFRPVKNLMIGLQNIVSVPVGQNNLSHHFWGYEPNIITDYQLGHFGIDNTVGVGIKSDRHNGGTTASVGSDIYEDLRLRYQVTHYFTPFVSYDYAKTNPGHYTQVDHSAGANSNVNVGDRINGSYQDISGAGGLIYLKNDQSSWLDIWYNVGFAGKNTTRVNGIFSRFVYLF